jgi:uncharacterized protein DUF955
MNRGVLTALRDVVPLRALSQSEAYRIAELQAARLLKLAGIDEPSVPDGVILDIPKVQVRYMKPWPVSGCTDWTGAMWTIALNAGEPLVRQRFSLAHEFKHILDNKFIEFLYPALPTMTSQQRAEAVCDYFSGCLLVPRPWLLNAWNEGLQSSLLLARHFDVSTAAIDVRLSQVGLRQPAHRQDWATRSRSGRYFRLGNVATACEVAA